MDKKNNITANVLNTPLKIKNFILFGFKVFLLKIKIIVMKNNPNKNLKNEISIAGILYFDRYFVNTVEIVRNNSAKIINIVPFNIFPLDKW